MAKPYTVEKISTIRKVVAASASISKKKNTIHSITEVDISKPLSLLDKSHQKYKEKLSFTGYLVCCLARTIEAYPRFNSFISGNKLVILHDIIISVLMEREIGNEMVPEPLVIRSCQNKEYYKIHEEIRKAQKKDDDTFGSLSDFKIIKCIPKSLMKLFVACADKNRRMALKYGKIGITSVGMFSKEPAWFIPHGSATVLLTVGSIIERVTKVDEHFECRKHLCLTVSFDHDIIDGAPAARFMNDLIKEIKSGQMIEKTLTNRI